MKISHLSKKVSHLSNSFDGMRTVRPAVYRRDLCEHCQAQYFEEKDKQTSHIMPVDI